MGFLNAPAVLAAAAASPTSAPSCSAPLITRLCDYKKPQLEFAVAENTTGCWEYCHNHPPCDFAVFNVGNPYTGDGSCWLYPGEQFDPSQGKTEGCENKPAYVYGKPVCSGGSGSGSGSGNGSPTATTDYSCTATESPSAVASVCGYPTPPDDCRNSCVASLGASECLSSCAKSDDCSFAVFNPHNLDNTQYSDGTCWIYPKGKYDPKAAKTCKGKPEQFVYENKCPKPPRPTSATKTAASKPTNAPGGGSEGSGSSGNSGSTGGSGGSGNAEASGSAAATASGKPGPVTNNQSIASGLSVSYTMAIGVAAFALLAL